MVYVWQNVLAVGGTQGVKMCHPFPDEIKVKKCV